MTKPGKSDFWHKVDWEGGIGGMLEYQGPSLTDWNLPKEFKKRWEALYHLYDGIQDTLNEWESELTESEDE